MIANRTSLITRLAALLAVAAFFAVGCDLVGHQQPNDALVEVTNDLDERISALGGQAISMSTSKASAKSAFALRAVSRIAPPSSEQSASHLSKSDDDVFVGYKIPGAPFGGGVDILDRSDPTNLTNEDNALLTDDLDVQEVLYDSDANTLYVAGAVDFTNVDGRDYGNTPAVLLSANIDDDGNVETTSDGDVEVLEAAMPNNLVKGLALPPSAGGVAQPHDNAAVYAVTDSSVLYSFKSNLSLRSATPISNSDLEFSSVASNTTGGSGKDVFALSKEGTVYRYDGSNNVTVQYHFGDLRQHGIARLTFNSHSGTASNLTSDLGLLYAAVNDGGFAVLKEDASEIFYQKRGQYYVSVTATDHDVDGSGDVARVFAAGPNGTIDVFEITSEDKLKNKSGFGPSDGLQLLGSFDLGALEENGIGAEGLGSAQVNQILVEDDYLYVAASNEGVVVLEIAENEGDIF